ncbi:MAG TPA: hypothetical protein VLA61_11760 [Ideonella sp.]|uniref:hypothetical protein n=1 Tax=Ideonella sp. TaxID=1929293 RepID=UPI002BB773F4|nr:hypothetical protein [Ideonella sp.]HSI48940.1 hypothetical protein [Ideonella sp.]
MVDLLSLARLGIATVSKWICFVDQGRYGIFDARVSIALRYVAVGHERAFPIVGCRLIKGQRAFRNDTSVTSNPTRMVRAYLDYLEVLSGVAVQAAMLPAEVEMALFMIGDVWADGHRTPAPLRRGMWS